MNQIKELKLETIHYELLDEIRSSLGQFIYYKDKYTKEEQKAINELHKASYILKVIERFQYKGRYSSKVILSINRTR